MQRFFSTMAILATLAVSSTSASGVNCSVRLNSVVSPRYAETIAHAIHSLTVQDLKNVFGAEKATEDNAIPTVARDLYGHKANNGTEKFAPSVELPEGFGTDAMKTLDHVLAHLGNGDDGLGHVWSPLERVVHAFHMRDLWVRIHDAIPRAIEDIQHMDDVCSCLVDHSETNGVEDKVKWIANEYKQWMPISLHEWGSKIPQLDKNTWPVWKKRLMFYYGEADMNDAALYMHCALRNFQ